ncbi:MAG: AHH domain-containing protein [Thalassolituus sp.]
MHNRQPYVFQTSLERRIYSLIDNEAELTEAVLNDVYITAQVEEGVARYREEAAGMSLLEVKGEGHSSGNLASNMARMGDPRPHELCDAHAVVSGAHPKAAPLRLILAKHRRRIDDPINGCWLPHNTAAKSHMPERLKNAVPHSRIHRHHYYGWLRSVLRSNRIKSQADLDKLLVGVSFRLQTGSLPQEVMLRADQKHEAF